MKGHELKLLSADYYNMHSSSNFFFWSNLFELQINTQFQTPVKKNAEDVITKNSMKKITVTSTSKTLV